MRSLLLALQVPKRLYTLEELRLNDVRPEEFLSPEDRTLNTVRTVLQVKLNQAAVCCLHCACVKPQGQLECRQLG